MPIHSWRCTQCKTEMDVMRGVDDYGVVPTDEELTKAEEQTAGTIKDSDCKHVDEEGKPTWKKFLSKPPRAAYGNNWGPWGGSGKGQWLVPLTLLGERLYDFIGQGLI